MTKVQVFREPAATLIESIWWDARYDELVWVDIPEGRLHRGPLDGARDGSDDRVTVLPAPVSSVQPAVGGGYVASLGDRVVLLDAEARVQETLAETPHASSEMRLNEGKVDPFGAFVVGSMDPTDGSPDGVLYRIVGRGAQVLRRGLGVANGIEWTADGRRMLVTDTDTHSVYIADYTKDGELGELEPYLTGHSSDGLTRQRGGGWWNGIFGDGEVVRWNDQGAVVGRVAIPAPNVTSVAFGGPAFDILFVGSAREELPDDGLERWPASGALFRVDDAGTGHPPFVFGLDGADAQRR